MKQLRVPLFFHLGANQSSSIVDIVQSFKWEHCLVAIQPNLLPGLQRSLHPSLQLESGFQWPPLCMCSSSNSNAHTRRSGTQSLSIATGSFRVILWCLHLLLRVTCFVPWGAGGGKGSVTSDMFPWGCEDTVVRRRLLFKVCGE